ncbi:hypothetical protein [Alcanivorax sp.]|uniref:hypothetical protein n=1 Tax=Alcanivorax sp. TaxID=1872427 RepID=UPI002B27B938|nr:hypothetical protein [Alcanivorax sp.]
MAFEHHERNKIAPLDDPIENLVIPDQVRVRQGGMWTVELFPPSQYESLKQSLRKNDWSQSPFSPFDEPNDKQVERAREGRGFSWARIGAVTQSNTRYLFPGTKRADLPSEFDHIELTAVQLGTSVTAIVAFFNFSEIGETGLNEVWKQKHEPKLTWKGLQRPKVTNRYFSGIEATQRERMRIHDLARVWLSEQFPGFFASRSNAQPVLDFNLFDGINPADNNDSYATREALRALGLDTADIYQYVSPQIKGAVLVPSYARGGPHEPLRNCWAIAGEYQRMGIDNKAPYDGEEFPSPRQLGYRFNDAAAAFTLHLAMKTYLSEQRAVYSTSRDLASTRHQRFTARKARKLSSELLNSGLDLPAVSRDSKVLIDKRWILSNEIKVKGIPISRYQDQYKPFDLIESFGKVLDSGFKELLEEDESYRTVLSTAAALGASADAAKTGTLALLVAAGSAIVAAISLLITEPGDASLWSRLTSTLEQTENEKEITKEPTFRSPLGGIGKQTKSAQPQSRPGS